MTPLSRRDVLDDVFHWDAVNWSRALDFWTTRTRLTLPAVSALELGALQGGLSLWLADRGASVVCSDREAPSPALHAKYGVTARYEALDACRIPYREQFDLVCFKSMLGAVLRDAGTPGARAAFESIFDALTPGGELWFAENLPASPLHRLARRVTHRTRWTYPTMTQLHAWLAPFEIVRLTRFGVLGTFGPTEHTRRLLGRMDRLVEQAVPEAWRYIAVGIARKGAH